MRTFELRRRHVVITGAASGIGQALAVVLAREGARLALVDVDAHGLARTAHEVRELGASVSTWQVDVADRARVHGFAEELVRDVGPVDALVNNAGVASSGRVEELRYETLEWTLGVNLWGVIHGTKAFLPHLLTRPLAALVNVSSVFGLMGVPGQAAYCTSKFAVRGFTEALRQELRGSPVAVTLVLPGGVRTNIVRSARSDCQVDAAVLQQAMGDFERQLGTSATAAAHTIVRGMRERRARVLVGRDAWAIDQLVRWWPDAYDALIARALGRSEALRRLVGTR